MGLYDSAYWFSWLTWEGIITLLSSLFITLFGMIFQFDMFLMNTTTTEKERTEKEFESLAKQAGFYTIRVACSAFNFSAVELFKST